MVGDDEFHRVHVGEGSGKELIHMATLGVELTDRDPICGQLWITTASSTANPPQIHRVVPLPTHRHESYGSPWVQCCGASDGRWCDVLCVLGWQGGS
jgi:hypothetical protein